MHTRSSEATDIGSPPASGFRAGSLLRRIAPALGVFFLAPLTAEYLIGYDTLTGNFGELLAGLLIFGPLYGAPALIIREVARRTGRGWPTMILLGLAFGVIQAGLIDHSLFNLSYRDIDSWQDDMGPTYIPALGISANNVLNFIGGHAIWSFSVPIALVETLVPYRRTTPWLGRLGSTVIVVLYLLAAALIFVDHVQQEQFLPPAPQLIGAAAVVVAVIGIAFAVGRRPRPPVDRPAPNPWQVGAVAFAAFNMTYLIEIVLGILEIESSFEINWWGVGLNSVLLAGLAIVVMRWSQHMGWGAAHRLALAGAALLSHAWLAFLVEPLGDVALYDKLMHNIVFALGALALLAIGAQVVKRSQAGYRENRTAESLNC